MSTITENLEGIRARIAAAAKAAGRDPAEVQLLAVSKKHSVAAIREALDAGQVRFGENSAQEAAEKIAAFSGACPEWHFIGQVQSNKTGLLAKNFTWVQSVDREKIAVRLNASRPSGLPALNVCVQLNLEHEATKSGLWDIEATLALAKTISSLPRLRLRGVMAIPPISHETSVQRQQFRAVREVYERLQAEQPRIDTLSMGMTVDFEAAIEEGSTLIRVGTAIFGERG